MTTRRLTITLGPDWPSALHRTGKAATATTHQGETLNFETPAALKTGPDHAPSFG